MNPAHKIMMCKIARSTISHAALLRMDRSRVNRWPIGLAGMRCPSPNSRIEYHQQHIGNQISADHEERGKHDASHHNVKVARKRGVEDEWPQPWPSANHLHKQRAADQASQ